jgi:hypothetical protein
LTVRRRRCVVWTRCGTFRVSGSHSRGEVQSAAIWPRSSFRTLRAHIHSYSMGSRVGSSEEVP